MNLICPIIVFRLITPLEADADLQVLFVCHLVCFHDMAETGSINADRFFHKHMAPSFDGGAVTEWMKTGLVSNYNTVAGVKASDCVLVGTESSKDPVLRQVYLAIHPTFGVCAIASDTVGSHSRSVSEYIGNGDNLDVVADLDTISDGTLGATANTDEGDFDFVASGSVSGLCNRETADQGSTSGKDS
jgi:hypothetical protein